MKTFTIITVCYNNAPGVLKTIESLLKQTCTDFEYLIQDGMSTDETISVAESFVQAFADKGIPYRIISEHDHGIYDAMNRAILAARGRWLLFLNSGDILADADVLETVKKSGKLDSADIVYGDVIEKNGDWYFYNRADDLEKIEESMPFCHQSVFAKRELHEQSPYSTEYRINSDYLFYYQQYIQGKQFGYIPRAISIFERGGFSSKNVLMLAEERLRIQEERPVRNEALIQKQRDILKRTKRSIFIFNHFSKYIPKKLRNMRRDRMRIKSGWKRKEAFFEELERKRRTEQ